MSVNTTVAPLTEIKTGGDVLDYLLAKDGLQYGMFVDVPDGLLRDQGSNDWYEAHLVDSDGRGVIRYIELAESGDMPSFSDLKRYLKRHGSPIEELFTVIAYRKTDNGPLTSTVTDDLTFLYIDEQFSTEDIEVTFDLKYFTIDRTGVEPVYLDFLDSLTVAGLGRSSLETTVGETFSIKEITNTFYETFGEIFRDDLQSAIHDIEDSDENVNAYTRKVVNRVLFLLFIEEKGWLDNDSNYIENKYEIAKSRDDLHVYDDFFEPLFFEALCDPVNSDYEFLGEIPFLNGGLFERTSIEEQVSIDETFFDALLAPDENEQGQPNGFLRRYKLTLKESNPSEQELVVDPEFVGRIFEMFMQDDERSEIGAFYTPKPITTYMAKNALKQHLLQDNDRLTQEEVVSLVSDHSVPDSLADEAITDEVIERLQTVSILDPAVGSGAFIIAVLNELVGITEAVNDARGVHRDRFTLKKEFIASNIYGVDTDPGGIELCKFRTWLYLVQDLDISHREFIEENERFALPNLGFKFFVGNSLVGEHDPTRIDSHFQETLSGGLVATKEEIKHIRRKHLTAYGDEKDRLATRLDDLTAKLESQLAVRDRDGWMTEVVTEADSLFEWSVNIPEVVLDGGFDIVIGNPPYEGQSQQDYIGALARFYDDRYDFYTTIPGMRHDLYQKFIIRGWELTRERGIFCYITSNTFLTIGSKQTTRHLLQENDLYSLLLANPETFDAAVNPAIFLLQKGGPAGDQRFIYGDASETQIDQYRSLVTQLIQTEPETMAVQADGGPIGEADITSLNLPGSTRGYVVPVALYRQSLGRAFFEPTSVNLRLFNGVLSDVRGLVADWQEELQDSSRIAASLDRIKSEHIDGLQPGDASILGLLAVGGVGLHTGSNDEYLAYHDGTRPAERVKERNDDFEYVEKNDNQFRWMSRIIKDDHIADVASLTQSEMRNGIENDEATWLPIEKGKGEPYYTEITEYINWSKDAVDGIRRDGSLRNVEYYFGEGIFAVGQGTGDPRFRYTNNTVIEHSGNILIPVTDKVSTKYLLGVLNSEFAKYLVNEFINHSVNTQLSDFRRLPIIIPTETEKASVERLVSDAIAAKKEQADADITDIQAQIDETIATIYDVPEFVTTETPGIDSE